MAKEEDEKQQEKQEEPTKSKKGLLQWIVLTLVVIMCAAAGFLFGRMLKGAKGLAAANAAQQEPGQMIEDSAPDDGKTWFYEKMEPVVANLNDPGVMRYVRATLTFEILSAAPEKETAEIFEKKAPVLTNWLTIYLASLGLEDIRGDKNLKRIQTQILDAFNEEIFPDQKPKIKHVLFREFAIQ